MSNIMVCEGGKVLGQGSPRTVKTRRGTDGPTGGSGGTASAKTSVANCEHDARALGGPNSVDPFEPSPSRVHAAFHATAVITTSSWIVRDDARASSDGNWYCMALSVSWAKSTSLGSDGAAG